MSTKNFDGSKVNGLANALDNRLKEIGPSNGIESDAGFNFFKNAVPILLSQMKPKVLSDAISNYEELDPNTPFYNCNVLVPHYSYSAEDDTWGTEIQKYDGLTGIYYLSVYLVEPMSPTSSTVRVIIGNYIFHALLETVNNKIEVSNGAWGRICFDNN